MMGCVPTKNLEENSEENDTGEQSQGKLENDTRKRNENEDTAKSEDPKNSMVQQPRGLYNLGNTCYFNSVMQPLSQTHSLHSKCNPGNGKITSSFISMFNEMTNEETAPFDATELRDNFVKTVRRFDNRRQHDSHECLRHFLDEVRKEERNKSSGDGSLTAVDKIFGGHLVTVYICKECDKHYHLFEPCLDISLPVFFEKVEERKITEKTEYNRTSENCQVPNQSEEQDNGVKPKKKKRGSLFKRKNHEEKKSRKDKSGKPGDEMEKCQANKDQTNDEKEGKYKEAISTLITRLSSESNSTADFSRGPNDMNVSRHSGRKSHAAEKKPINLNDCLKHFSRVEQIIKEYLCEDCLREAMARGEASEDNLKLTSATKQTLIFNPPAILTIHFKRFELLPGRSKKRSDMVEYPEYLDIAPYCSSQCLRNYPPKNNIWYSLYAVVVHSGSLDSGHYVAYVKVREREKNTQQLKELLQNKYFNHNITSNELITTINDPKRDHNKLAPIPSMKGTKAKNNAIVTERVESKWYLLNDSFVNEVSLKKVLEQEAYLLFYERVSDAEYNEHVAESNKKGAATEDSHVVEKTQF